MSFPRNLKLASLSHQASLKLKSFLIPFSVCLGWVTSSDVKIPKLIRVVCMETRQDGNNRMQLSRHTISGKSSLAQESKQDKCVRFHVISHSTHSRRSFMSQVIPQKCYFCVCFVFFQSGSNKVVSRNTGKEQGFLNFTLPAL